MAIAKRPSPYTGTCGTHNKRPDLFDLPQRCKHKAHVRSRQLMQKCYHQPWDQARCETHC